MGELQVYFLCPRESLVYLPQSVKHLKEGLKADVRAWNFLGPKDERKARLAYDLGGHGIEVLHDWGWPAVAEHSRQVDPVAQALFWFPQAVLVKSWNPGTATRLFGPGLGLVCAWKEVPPLLGALEGPVEPETLARLAAPAGPVAPFKAQVKSLPTFALPSWERSLGLAKLFTDAVWFHGGD